ncbi:MAG: polysaccharide deacetylase family protein, partial [Actinobacteria bacterium]|nr:polysaccharide deacetylase family protein [Actinomycetota bacterium]
MNGGHPGRRLILTFHGVGPPRRELPDGEARFWVDEARLAAILDAVVGRDEVEVTFDDGNASDVEIALPALLDRGLSAQFFIIAGRLGQPGSLTPAQVGELAAQGMAIGAHGVQHRSWRGWDRAALVREIRAARVALEDAAGSAVT